MGEVFVRDLSEEAQKGQLGGAMPAESKQKTKGGREGRESATSELKRREQIYRKIRHLDGGAKSRIGKKHRGKVRMNRRDSVAGGGEQEKILREKRGNGHEKRILLR